MKEVGLFHWTEPNLGATNSSGFTGLPGGNRNGSGPFNITGISGFWWSSSGTTGSIQDIAWFCSLQYDVPNAFKYYGPKSLGLSVRCLKD